MHQHSLGALLNSCGEYLTRRVCRIASSDNQTQAEAGCGWERLPEWYCASKHLSAAGWQVPRGYDHARSQGLAPRALEPTSLRQNGYGQSTACCTSESTLASKAKGQKMQRARVAGFHHLCSQKSTPRASDGLAFAMPSVLGHLGLCKEGEGRGGGGG